MNIVEALKIAKEQGKKVRPVGEDNWAIEYKDGSFLQNYETSDNPYLFCYALTEDILEDWEVLPTAEELLIVKGKAYDVARFCYEIENCENCPMYKYCRKITDVKDDYLIDVLTCNAMQSDEWFRKNMDTINEMWDKLNKED